RSEDDTRAVLQRLAREDPRIRVVDNPQRTTAAGLNAALAHARGRYVARMDADDFALSDRLARQRAYLDAHPDVGLVACRVEHRAPEGQSAEGYAWHVDWLNGVLDAGAIALNRFVESPFAHPSVMFRAELVEQHGGYRDGPFPEDYELWLRWLEAGVRMHKLNETLLVWNDLPGRLSRTHANYAIDAFYALKAEYLARWLTRHNPRHPEVVIWGAGKTSRRRAALLEAQGIVVTAYVDVAPYKRGRQCRGRPIWIYDELTEPAQGFVVSYVGKRGAGEFVRGHLLAHGFVEGRDFILAA
ncbi:MAG TPA: glycosyltransferase, partial [Oscillatoriaceae cyanobacterium]